MIEHLESERLIIRPIAINDAAEVLQYRSDVVTNKYQNFHPNTMNDVLEFINKTSTEIDIPDTWYQVVIICKANQKIIGDIGIHFLGDDNQQAEIGCTLSRNYHKQGYAAEAIRVVINFLFGRLAKHRIIASIDPQNIASINLMFRLGFRKEAHFKESIFSNGEWTDDIVFAMLNKDWENQFTASVHI